MNRRNFLSDCALGACACTAASVLTPIASIAAETSTQPDDWRIGFVKTRYTKLLELLSQRIGADETGATLRALGRYCAEGLPQLKQHVGDVDGFIADFCAKSGEQVTYDREHGIVTVVGPERGACFCPLVDTHKCPKVVCDCSLGWQQQVYETLFGRPVEVSLKESVVRGGKRCIFEIRVQQPALG